MRWMLSSVVAVAAHSAFVSAAFGQTQVESVSTVQTITSPSLNGSANVSVPQFDTMGGMRELVEVRVVPRVVGTSRISGSVSTSAPPGVETQARLRLNAEIDIRVPGGSAESRSRFIPSTVFSSNGPITFNGGATIAPPTISYSLQTRPPQTPFIGMGSWTTWVIWDLDTSFEIQDGPFNVWSYQHQTTTIRVELSVFYEFRVRMSSCGADFNNDGDVDLDDFADFGTEFGRGLPGGGPACDAASPCLADFDDDGDVDLDDFAEFGSQFGRGLPGGGPPCFE